MEEYICLILAYSNFAMYQRGHVCEGTQYNCMQVL
jgi:hypothetical protein